MRDLGATRHRLGLLFDGQTRRRLGVALAGSVVVAFSEIIAVGATLPLMQVLTGSTPALGPLTATFERWTGGEAGTMATVLAVVIFVCFVVKGAFTIVYRWWVLGFTASQQVRTTRQLFDHYLASPYTTHQTRTTAELVRTLSTAVQHVYTGVVLGSISIATELITIVAILAALLALMPVPAAIMLVYFGLVGLVLFRATRSRATAAGRRALEMSEATFKAQVEPLAAFKDVRIKGNADYFGDRLSSVQTKATQAQRTSSFIAELPKYVLEMVFILGVALMTVVVFSTTPSAEAVSMLALFAVAGFRLLPSLTRLMASTTNVRVGRPGLSIVLDELAVSYRRQSSEVELEHRPTVTLDRALELSAVTFRYPSSDHDVLRGIDLSVPFGTSVALVGGSGAGKSTLVDIILGLHCPSTGRVLADGVNVHENLPAWHSGIALVPQEVVTLDDTIEANVLFGDDPDDPENRRRLLRAVDRAQLSEHIASLPEGLDSQVGEWGSRLSGGQRQRLGIARALYREPRLLVLDEATSALDNDTERRITETIRALHGEVTVVVVAHRLSTVRQCDQVVYLSDGLIEAQGSFEDVRRASAHFDHLVRLGNLESASG